jgi:hypothetical protein
MRKIIFRLIVAYLRRRGGEVHGYAPAYLAVPRHKRKYHICLMSESHYLALKSGTWTRGTYL